jgi:hypothetical protein
MNTHAIAGLEDRHPSQLSALEAFDDSGHRRGATRRVAVARGGQW